MLGMKTIVRETLKIMTEENNMPTNKATKTKMRRPFKIVDHTEVRDANDVWIADTCFKMIHGRGNAVIPTRADIKCAEMIVMALNADESIPALVKEASGDE